MDEYSIGSPRDAAARRLGQDAARSFVSNPVEGDTMESFVVSDVTGEIVRLTHTMQKAAHAQIKAWRRRHFVAPIALAVTSFVTSLATTPRANTNDSWLASTVGLLGLAAGVVWLIVVAFQASQRLSHAQKAREAETGRLLTIAREAATTAYVELGRADVSEGEADAADAAVAAAMPQRTIEVDEDARTPVRQERRVAGGPPPPGQPFGVSQEGARYLVATWMRHLGESDAGTTEQATAGGVDAASARCVAKVQNDAGSVGVEEVRALADAASNDGRRPLFFASGAYADDAQAFAEQAGVALFTYDAVAGTLDGANARGRAAVAEGIT